MLKGYVVAAGYLVLFNLILQLSPLFVGEEYLQALIALPLVIAAGIQLWTQMKRAKKEDRMYM